MITKDHILTFLLATGLLSFWAASQFYEWKLISGAGYDRLYSLGLLYWVFRQRFQAVSLFDAMVGNIAVWLCIFNVYDEFFSKTPATPYKPGIITTVVIVTCVFTYYRKCNKLKKDSKK